MSNEKGSSSRRDFVRLMLGGFVAPSMIWPFRKYFLPPAHPTIDAFRNFYAVEWASTYHDCPRSRRIENIDGPHPGDDVFSFNYYFVGRDGNLTVASPLVNYDAWGKPLRSFATVRRASRVDGAPFPSHRF